MTTHEMAELWEAVMKADPKFVRRCIKKRLKYMNDKRKTAAQ